jgi:FkbM family methyltransferase
MPPYAHGRHAREVGESPVKKSIILSGVMIVIAAAAAHVVLIAPRRVAPVVAPASASASAPSPPPALVPTACLPVPCSSADPTRRVFETPGLGKFCLETNDSDAIKNVLRSGQAWESGIEELIKKHTREGSTAVDAGAHIGSHTVTLSRAVGPKGRVFAFEPQTKIYQELLVNLELNGRDNVYTYFAALGDAHKRVTMSPTVQGNEGGTNLGAGGNQVEMLPLDHFRLEDVSIIKIDVEGAEYDVLRGAAATIRKNKPVLVVEIMGGSDIDKAAPDTKAEIVKTIDLIKSMGYEVRRIDTWDYLGLPAGVRP